MKKKNIIFTSLAMYQAPYFTGLAKEFSKLGYDSCVISFHQRSCSYISNEGVLAFDVFANKNKYKYLDKGEIENLFIKKCAQLNIENPRLILSHEMVTFNITQSKQLKIKFLYYCDEIEKIIRNFVGDNQNGEVIVVQETGGFISLLATYYLSRILNFKHLFLEPSLYKGRLNACYNSYVKASFPLSPPSPPPKEALAYIDNTLREKNLVIPFKDRAAYKSPISKILNLYNLRRLIEKLTDKIVLKKEEEFSHIGNYVNRHYKMAINRFRFLTLYKDLPENQKFIYYPFHVPIDMALTLRSPEYLDQYSLIDYFARCAPSECKIVIKEHPAMIGFLNFRRMKDLLRGNDNIIFLNPSINNLDLMKNASLIITVNSKSGAEAVLLEKNVISLGQSFYSSSKAVLFCQNLTELPMHINNLTQNKNVEEVSKKAVLDDFISLTWSNSFPGELYSNDKLNLEISAKGIQKFVSQFNE